MTMLMVAALMAVGPPLPTLGPDEKVKAKEFHVTLTQPCRRRCRMRHKVKPYSAKLDRIAGCESGGNWHINTGNGFYGGLQFTYGTWKSVGGPSWPHLVSKLEQKYRAVKVYVRRGNWGDWPVCGYR